MKFCPKCGNQLDDNANFCGRCGALLSKEEAKPQQQVQNNYKICPVCGNKVPVNAPTCYVCGADLSAPAAPQGAPAPQAAPNYNQPQVNRTNNAPAQGGKSTGSLVLGILSLVSCFIGFIIFGIIFEPVGLICGIISIVLGVKNNYKAGKILGIIGTSLCGVFTLIYLISLMVLGRM